MPNHERSPLPLLTVLLLLTGERQEEGDGASNEGTWRPLRCGHLGGLFLWSQKVLRSVLLDVLLDWCLDLPKVVPIGSTRSYYDPYGIPPSPCKALPKKSSEVPFSSEGGTFQRLGGPGSFHKAPGCPENVLVEVLMETMVVLVENMCVGGTLKTFS